MRGAFVFLLLAQLVSSFDDFKSVNGTLVKCRTTAADGRPVIIEVIHDWAPLGASRFIELVKSDYFTDVSSTQERMTINCWRRTI